MSSRQTPQCFEEAPTFFHIVVPGSRYVEISWGIKQFNQRGSPACLADFRYAGLRLRVRWYQQRDWWVAAWG